MVGELFPHQQEAAFLRFHIVPVSEALVTGLTRSRGALCLLAALAAAPGARAGDLHDTVQFTPWTRGSEPLQPGQQQFASRIWSDDDVAAPSRGGPDLADPPAGPPIWESGASEPVRTDVPATKTADVKEAKPEDPPLAQKPTPPKPIENLVDPTGKIQMPSPERIAQELGYKLPEFKKYVEDFASSISMGPHSAAFRRLCARDEDSCRLLADFQAQASDAKRERKHQRHRVAHFHITEANVAQAQRFDFQVLANNLKIESVQRLTSLAERSLKETECPRNLSAALAVKAEDYFPDAKIRQLSRDLFEHARPCLSTDDEIFERLYLRFGLYAIYDGDRSRATAFLKEAMKSTNSTERYRVLYWLGKLAFEDGEKKGQENEYWTELTNQFPLSFYAIDAAASLGRDPVEMITQRKVGGLKREAQNDPELNRMIRWLEALYTYKESNAVGKWAAWIVRANEGELDVDVLLYLSSLKIASGLYRSNIQMLFGYFRKNPAALNGEGLKLLYPRPYFDLIQDASRGKIDSFLVMGLVRQESGFDARAISHAHAKGLMQIIPQTARRLASRGQYKLLNEKENTKMGVKYLLELAGGFENSVELVLAAYNAGPLRVTEWLRRNPDRKRDILLWNDLIPYMETRDYVVSILRNNYLYARLYGNREPAAAGLFASDTVNALVSKAAAAK
jgi:soluble lytic murein transglycosylase-like protein